MVMIVAVVVVVVVVVVIIIVVVLPRWRRRRPSGSCRPKTRAGTSPRKCTSKGFMTTGLRVET